MKSYFFPPCLILIFFFPLTKLIAQVPDGNSVIRLVTLPDQVKLKINKLDYKALIQSDETFIITDVPEGTYKFNFRLYGRRLNKSIFIPANDTVTVLADFRNMSVSSATAWEFRNIIAEQIMIERRLDSLWEARKKEIGKFTPEKEIRNDEVFYIVEDMPMFNGGDPAIEFRKYIAMNLRYPETAASEKIQGRVIVAFAVNKYGEVEDAKVAVGVHPELDKEALRVVNESPAWRPGYQRGVPVKVLFTFPINFVLK